MENCTTKEFKKDISELCTDCPLKSKIEIGLQKQITSQVNEKKDILTPKQYEEYIVKQIDVHQNAMQTVYLTEMQNADYKNDPHRPKRVELYIWNKECIKTLNKLILTEPTESKLDILKGYLIQYGFFELEKVKELSEYNKILLVEKLSEGGLPYGVAMFDYLEFFKYLQKHYFDSKYKLFREVSKWFNRDKEGRAVKGNISSLLKNTTENKERYTAYKHKEQVVKDYQELK